MKNTANSEAERERQRIIGLLLAAVGRYRLAGQLDIAAEFDRFALLLEHPNAE